MKYLDEMMAHIQNEYELFEFLKREVVELRIQNYHMQNDVALARRSLNNMVQKAYDFGYDEGLRGVKHDRKFKHDTSEGNSL